MNNLLYFPYISIEKSPWLYKSLLYWDSISVITPLEYFDHPSRFENYMNPLIKEEMVKLVFPHEYIYRNSNEFSRKFVNHIRENYFELCKGKRIGVVKDKRLVPQEVTKIHMDKLEYSIGEFLIEHGMAYRNGSWLCVKRPIARDFMHYLALLIGNIGGFSPTTDSVRHISQQVYKIRMPSPSRDDFRGGYERFQTANQTFQVLDGIFSIPKEITDIYDIIDFKQKNYDLLSNFQRLIGQTVSDIETFPIEQHKSRLQYHINHLEEEKQRLNEKMKEKWKITDFTSLAWTAPQAYILANNYEILSKQQTILYTTTLLRGVYDIYTSRRRRIRELNHNPLAYVLEAQRTFN
ncbi:hypothetical protein [Robertmurraya kyonggiensis]|uniref:Uncharacterized protein n=1 Tax=Robertmurraya kyonggiensis TaxID=1037680 RepID=A0A4U1DCY9_9BACI|nr:hypothetical protein [Robertmurraya kyonggiensis]TKC19893.1 hypothetical protein FA727_10270 [Robertmurraya kyonggiensis]